VEENPRDFLADDAKREIELGRAVTRDCAQSAACQAGRLQT